MTEGRNRRNNNKTKKSANDRVIYLNRKDILSNTNRRRRTENTRQSKIAGRRRAEMPEQKLAYPATRRRMDNRREMPQHRRRERTATGAARMPQQSRSIKPRTDTGRRQAASQRPAMRNQRPAPRPAAARKKRVNKRNGERYFKIASWLPPIFLSCNSDAAGEPRKYKRTSRRGNNKGMLIVAAVIAMLFIVYISGYAMNIKHTDKIAYETIQLGSVDSAKKADGIIIRSEKVFTAPSSGAVKYAVAENEKIRSGTVVCSISNAQTVAKMQENLDTINDDIMKLQQSREDISEHTQEVTKLETQIKNLTDERTFNFVNGNFTEVYNLKYSVENKLNTRNQLLLSENSGSLSDLVGQRNDELKEMNSNIKQISADVGGIVCYSIDGTESTLTPDKVAKLTKEQVTAKPNKVESVKANIAANEPVFKVITSNEWYIASYMPDTYTEGWETGQDMELYLQNGVEENRTLDVTLTVLEHGQGEAYVVFKTADFMADYMDLRNISFEIDKPKTGYKIPNTAISQQTLLKIPSGFVDKNSNTVVKSTESGDKTLEITISGTETEDKTEYTLIPVQIGYLAPGDTLKSGDKTIKAEDVVTVDGVFLVNSGVTKFVKINKDGSVTGGDYTVLDESKNPNIHIYDRVVQNVSNVQENQNIYE